MKKTMLFVAVFVLVLAVGCCPSRRYIPEHPHPDYCPLEAR